jgi:hypothetical protein
MAEDTAPRETPREMGGNDPEDMDAVADRLEAALERIARHLETAHLDTAHLDTGKPAPPSAELVARLDGLIVRLRDLLGGPPSPSPD